MSNIDIKSFPHSVMRKGQKTLLDILERDWDKYQYWVFELPTGFGKSAIAKTIAESVNQSYIITSTKQLQDQYVNDFKDKSIVSIKGKSNYKCALNNSLSCENGYCLIDKQQLIECKHERMCPYMNARQQAIQSKIALTSYQYFLRAVEGPGIWKARDVVIFDECHLLEDQIVQWAEIKISPKELVEKYNISKNCNLQDFIEISVPPEKSGYEENKRWLNIISKLVFNRRNEKFEEIKRNLGFGNIKDPDSLTSEQLDTIFGTHKEYYELDKLFKKIDIFCISSDHDDWIIDPWEDGLQLTPINVSTLFHFYIKKMGIKKFIFMSASILDLPGFRKSFGLPKDKTLLIKADSDFSPKKSPIIYNPICKMNYQEIDNNLEKIKTAVEDILEKHKDEKGIIHTGNYKIATYLINNIKSNRLIMKEQNGSNEKLLERHYKDNLPTVLVSPSLTTGTDLKDDFSRWQIIVKLPFLSISDRRVKEKLKRNNQWYVVQMFRTFIQASGRSTRSKDDWSITYVLDSSFKWWFNHYKNKGWFQPQFKQRINWGDK